jgi:hypothetical protein
MIVIASIIDQDEEKPVMKTLTMLAAIIAAIASAATLLMTIENHDSATMIPIASVPVGDNSDCPECSRIVLQMAKSMRSEPGAWTTDGYRVNRKDASVWVANCDYAAKIGPSEHEMADLPNHSSDVKALCAAYREWAASQGRFQDRSWWK